MNLVCESIGDILKPKSEEEVRAAYDLINAQDLLLHGVNESNIDMVEEALKRGATPKHLELAVSRGYDFVELLLKYGANPDGDRSGNPMETACSWMNRGKLNIPQLLIQYGADPSPGLARACSRGYYKLAKFLLDNGADVHYRGDDAIHEACKAKGDNIKIVKLLFEHGASTDVRYNNGLLADAAYDGNLKICKFLIREKGLRDNENNAAKAACTNNHPVILELLIKEGGSEVNTKYSHGYWDQGLLLNAIKASKYEIVEVLLKHGAKTSYLGHYLKTNNDKKMKDLIMKYKNKLVKEHAPGFLSKREIMDEIILQFAGEGMEDMLKKEMLNMSKEEFEEFAKEAGYKPLDDKYWTYDYARKIYR